MAIPRWISAPAGRIAQISGRTYDYLTPGAGTSTLTNAGRAITDTNKVFRPQNLGTGMSVFQPAANPQVYNPSAGSDSQMKQKAATDGQYSGETAPNPGTVSYGSGGGTGAAPTFDRNGFMAQLTKKWTDLGSVLNDLYGQIDTLTRDRADQLNQNYTTQENQLAKDYADVAGKTASAYAGRGLADSSYLGEAQDANMNTYNTTLSQLGQDKQSNYAALGRYNQEQKAGIDATRNQYGQAFGNLDSYDDQGLVDLGSNLDTSAASAATQRASLGTDSDYVKALNSVTPIQQQGSAQLQARLQNLVASTAPANAKRQIARGFIKTATLNDPAQADYWNTQFETLLANAGQ